MTTLSVHKQITLTDLAPEIKSHIKKSLTLENPLYHKLINMGVNRYAAARDFKYYEGDKENGGLIVPRGMRNRLQIFFQRINTPTKITEEVVNLPFEKIKLLAPTLRNYQEPLVEAALKHREGIIRLSTGGGKTIVGLEIIRRLGLKATVLVPNTVLLEQFVNECATFFGYRPAQVGGGCKEIGEITIATFQGVMADEGLLRTLAKQTSVLIVDECQSAVSDKREELLKQFYPARIYGLSATPHRSKDDGRSEAVKFYFGDIVADYEVKQLEPSVEVVYTGVEIPFDDYHRMIDTMVAHESRNTLISGLVLGEIFIGRKVLILTKRIEHYKNIQKKLSDNDRIFYIDSTDKNRNALLGRMKRNEIEFSAVFGTVSLLGVGLDIPSFDTLILACDMKSDVLTEQSAGRILRIFEGKQSPKVIDLYDNKNPAFKKQFWERYKVYDRKGWKTNIEKKSAN